MADINALVEATIRQKNRSAPHVGWPLAAIKAVEGKGIRHKPDVKRLTKAILAKLRKDKII